MNPLALFAPNHPTPVARPHPRGSRREQRREAAFPFSAPKVNPTGMGAAPEWTASRHPCVGLRQA
jgi:hypothetical protein